MQKSKTNKEKILGTVPKKLQLVETFLDCPEFSENTKNQKGITLIALIITIIVMLILVGVTINVVLNGGLFGKAKEAAIKMEEKTIYDQIVGAMQLTNEGKINVKGTYGAAKAILEAQGNTVTSITPATEEEITDTTTSVTFDVRGKNGTYTYTVTREKIVIGKIEEVEKFEIQLNSQEYDATNDRVILKISLKEGNIFLTEDEAVSLYINLINNMLGTNSISSFEDLILFMYYEGDPGENTYEDLISELNLQGKTPGEVFKIMNGGESIEKIICDNYLDLASIKTLKINGENVTESVDWYSSRLECSVQGNGTYEISLEADGMIATKTVEINNGTVIGRYVKYDSNGDGSINDEILYRVFYIEGELGEGKGAQIITNDLSEEVIIGCYDDTIPEGAVTEDLNEDGNLNFEKAIYSYNNAIATLNKKCKELVKTREGITEGVRSIGTDPLNPEQDTNEYIYESDITGYIVGTDTWFNKYNGLIKNRTISEIDFSKLNTYNFDLVQECWMYFFTDIGRFIRIR